MRLRTFIDTSMNISHKGFKKFMNALRNTSCTEGRARKKNSVKTRYYAVIYKNSGVLRSFYFFNDNFYRIFNTRKEARDYVKNEGEYFSVVKFDIERC